MNDDLKKRLRVLSHYMPECGQAADYIEKLEASLVRTFEHMMEDGKRIETLEAVLEKISRERTLWGAMRKADHALGRFDSKAPEKKND
jgi:uncharacterized protein YigA (DUF484 family)